LRAEGSSPKAGKLPQAGRMQLAQCRNVDQSAQKAARPKQERSTSAQKAARPKPKSCPKRAKAALANKDWDFLQSSSPKSGKHPAQ